MSAASVVARSGSRQRSQGGGPDRRNAPLAVELFARREKKNNEGREGKRERGDYQSSNEFKRHLRKA